MNLLFLDDEREPDDVYWVEFNYSKHNITLVKNSEEFLGAVKANKFDSISLDNDLGLGLREGYYILQDLCSLYMDEKIDWFPSTIICHTMNSIARDQMVTFAQNFSERYSLDVKVITHER